VAVTASSDEPAVDSSPGASTAAGRSTGRRGGGRAARAELFGLADDAPFVQVVAFRPMMAAGLLVLSALTRTGPPALVAVALLPAVVAAVALGAVVPGRSPARTPAGSSLNGASHSTCRGRADPATLAATIRANRPRPGFLPEAGQRYQRRLTPLLAGLGYRSWVTSSAASRTRGHRRARAVGTSRPPLELDTAALDTLAGAGSATSKALWYTPGARARQPGWAAELGTLRQWCADRAARTS